MRSKFLSSSVCLPAILSLVALGRVLWQNASGYTAVATATFAYVVSAILYSHAAVAMAHVGHATIDAQGVLHFPVTSSYQPQVPNNLRVLLPRIGRAHTQPRFLYVLPVEAGGASTYGDGLDTVRRLGLQDSENLIVVEPEFAQIPWYADHPTDPTKQQERYFVEDIVEVVEMLFPQSVPPGTHPVRLLVGFSKSGMGAISLILRHPNQFDAAAAWDAPLNQGTLSALPGMIDVFASEANYQTYALPRALPIGAAPFRGSRRLWLGGYSGWRADMTAAESQMSLLGMLHDWVDGPPRAHGYDSGWIEAAVLSLTQAIPPHASSMLDAAAIVDAASEIDGPPSPVGGCNYYVDKVTIRHILVMVTLLIILLLGRYSYRRSIC